MSDRDTVQELAEMLQHGKPKEIEIDTYELTNGGAICVVQPLAPDQFDVFDATVGLILSRLGIPMSD